MFFYTNAEDLMKSNYGIRESHGLLFLWYYFLISMLIFCIGVTMGFLEIQTLKMINHGNGFKTVNMLPCNCKEKSKRNRTGFL